jgi:glutathione-regulated potassium-efflux system protein KefB
MAPEHDSSMLVNAVALLGAAVITVPLFRRLGLGSVLGYLAAGLLIGPFGFGLFSDPHAILQFAELGVVMFLFIIGLEMRPSHLWHLRRQIFGLGTLQISACTLGLTGVGMAFGLSPVVAFVGGAGFVLTSTAIVMQLLAERGDIALPHGQKMVSVLLFEDLLIVPLLALVTFLSPNAASETDTPNWIAMLTGIGSLAGLIAAGVWLLNPLFSLLALARTREIMSAAALLVVLGSALLMEMGGLSMAMGAFLAGVLLSESTFRHQLEADVEPFRGLLLGLFFLAVGMSLDLKVVADNWAVIAAVVPAMMATKALCIYIVARVTHSSHEEALDRAVLMAQGGEFAFVLYGAAAAVGIIDETVNANMTAVVVLSMVLTPLVVIVVRRFIKPVSQSLDGIPIADGLEGSVLMIGFGRFGQVVSQALLARGVEVSIIDADVEMIRAAQQFGFTVYYGDGTRLDVLRASGAGKARQIAVCVENRATADRIVELVRSEFPQAQLLVRAFDREHARQLVGAGVDYQIRETFESALQAGGAALRLLEVGESEIVDILTGIRERDAERFALEIAGGGYAAGLGMLLRNTPQTPSRPTPFSKPRTEGKALNELPTESPSESPT